MRTKKKKTITWPGRLELSVCARCFFLCVCVCLEEGIPRDHICEESSKSDKKKMQITAAAAIRRWQRSQLLTAAAPSQVLRQFPQDVRLLLQLCGQHRRRHGR